MKARSILSIFMALALATLLTGCFKSELQVLKDKVKKEPTSVKDHINLAYYYRQNNRLQDALNEYNESLRLRPNDFMASMNKGEVLFTMKKYTESVALFESLLKKNPKNSVLYNNIAMCYHQMGNFPKALSKYNEALKLNPNNEPAIKGLDFLKADIKAVAEKMKKKSDEKPKKEPVKK